MKQILEIPDNFRTDVLVQVGYPAHDRLKPIKRKAGSDVVYYNRHGVLFNE